jgi:hypothetical protein
MMSPATTRIESFSETTGVTSPEVPAEDFGTRFNNNTSDATAYLFPPWPQFYRREFATQKCVIQAEARCDVEATLEALTYVYQLTGRRRAWVYGFRIPVFAARLLTRLHHG